MINKYWLYLLALPKTLVFNFYYFPFVVAIKLPVFCSHRVLFQRLGGDVNLPSKCHTGMIKLGFGNVGIFDQHRSRTIWEVSGLVVFGGVARIGHGSKIAVGNNGQLILGNNFVITAESAIVAMTRIEIGSDVLISWDTLIIDSDFHTIFDETSRHINPNLPIVIGNKVWIGCRSLILKGSCIPDGVVVAAASTVSKREYVEKSIIGGNPAKLLKENISWKM